MDPLSAYALVSMGAAAALRDLGLEKTAAVPRAKKQYRRALQMLLEGDTAFHGTTPKGIAGIAASGHIRPGNNNMHGVAGIPDAYFGSGTPAWGTAIHQDTPIVAVSKTRALANAPVAAAEGISILREMPGNFGKAPGDSGRYLAVPGGLDLLPKDTVILPKGQQLPGVRENRLRRIDSDAFDAAFEEVHPGGRAYQRFSGALSPYSPEAIAAQAAEDEQMTALVRQLRAEGKPVHPAYAPWDVA